MENIEYVTKMFQEFMKANHIQDNFSNFSNYQDMFIDWLAEKAVASRKYAGLVSYMEVEGDNVSRRVVEFNKGIYDSAMIGLKDLIEIPPVVVSPYADTLEKVEGIEAAPGKLVCLNNEVYVGYRRQEDYFESPNCTDIFGDDIGTLLTQTPFTIQEIVPYLLLLDGNKTIFLGTNGNSSDNDKYENINTILNLHYQLETIEDIQTEFIATTQGDSYLAALKMTPMVKIKKLEKVI